MCLAIPSKVISVENGKIIVDELGKDKKIKGSLIQEIKAGDYVLLQNNFIIRKIKKKEAEKIIDLINDNL